MKVKYKLFLIGFFIIGVFDTLTSLASKQFDFNYTYLASGSFVIYFIFGFWATKEMNLKVGVLIAATIGFFDSTVGWGISIFLKANTGNIKNDPSIAVWIISAILVTGLAAICGLVGGRLAKAFTKNKYSDRFNSPPIPPHNVNKQ